MCFKNKTNNLADEKLFGNIYEVNYYAGYSRNNVVYRFVLVARAEKFKKTKNRFPDIRHICYIRVCIGTVLKIFFFVFLFKRVYDVVDLLFDQIFVDFQSDFKRNVVIVRKFYKLTR